jgi:putative ABC transport system substrate-binding protein
MKRREFIALVGGAAAAWPTVGRAQQSARMPTIGFLSTSTPASWSKWTPAFVQRLRELGWIEGSNIVIEYRWAEGIDERYVEMAGELVRLKVDIIVTSGGALLAAKQATSVIPIVFAAATDPVGSGLVASLARPGGNITGISAQGPDLSGKRLELLREIVPGLRRIAIMANVGYAAIGQLMQEIQTAARKLGIDVVTLDVRRADEITSAFELIKGRAEALYIPADPLVNSNRVRIAALAQGIRLPTMFDLREYVASGGLVSYGPSFSDLFRRAADYADKILRGAKPGEIPVEQPIKFEMAINLKIAKALGIEIPPKLLFTADEVIE